MAIRCLRCGASSADGADWCGQCYEPFATPAPAPAVEPPPAPTPPPARPRPVGDGPTEPRWTCPVCETANPIARDACAACTTSMVAAFGGTTHAAEVDAAAVRRWSFLPGAGHMKAGAGLTGGAVLLVVAMAAIFGGALVGATGTRATGTLILIVGAGTWLAAAWDVERWLRDGGDWFLRPRLLSGLAGAVLVLLMVGVYLAI